MELSPEQRQTLLNEAAAEARSGRQALEREEIVQKWMGRSDRWRLPVPETESDPALPETHDCPLGAVSWMFSPATRAKAPVRFWTLMDRLWGVLQADESPSRIVVEEVTWPTEVERAPTVRFGESDRAWGAKLLSMMMEVRDEMERHPATPDLTVVDQMMSRLQTQLETLETEAQ